MSSEIKMSVGLMFFSLLSCVVGQRVYNFPFNCTEPERIKDYQIKCPIRQNELSLEAHHVEVDEKIEKICRPPIKDDDHIEGYICREQHWTTKCTETWYFSTEIEYTIKETIPNQADCQKELEKLKRGISIPPYYPPAGCFWNMAQSEKITFVVLVPHKVLQNPYDMKLYDPGFLEKCDVEKAKTKGCKMKDITGLWVTNNDGKNTSEHCNKDHWECIGIKSFRSELNLHDRLWESPELGIMKLNKACKKNFCGYKGVILEDGEWWSYTNLADSEIEYVHLNNCDESRLPGFRIHQDRTEFEEFDIKAEMENERCMNTLSKILNRENLNFVDMSYLSPSRPGRDYAYLFEQVSWDETFCLTWPESKKSKNCKIDWKANRNAGLVTKKHGAIGTYYRSMCMYYQVEDTNKDGILQKEELRDKGIPGKNRYRTLKRSKNDYGEDSEFNITYNGMLVVNESFHMAVKSIYDGTEDYNSLLKFEVSEFDKIDLNEAYKEEEKKWNDIDLTPVSSVNRSRSDIIKEVEKGGRKIISAVTGWFTGLAKTVRWTIWGIGSIVTIYAIWKLKKMITKKNKEDKNLVDHNELNEAFEMSKDVERGRVETWIKKNKSKDEGIYEQVTDIEDSVSKYERGVQASKGRDKMNVYSPHGKTEKRGFFNH
ncbi:virion transmembrane glycoprotein [Malakal virus]|uniref:Virion transmembrane glycoprotein n=1 Tax=Malakal virus TaxID=1229186 RepID=J9U782_9RHAB|nr:virion transmembrane glycoprotein [Malakal virus]AFR67111.1 virion transmembrane glycoprotein [Malakal virus]